MLPTTEQIAMRPDDYQCSTNCDSICPWISSLADKAVNKFCEIFLDDDFTLDAYLSTQNFDTEDDPDNINIPIRSRHTKRRRPSRKKKSFIKYALPHYPSSSEESQSNNSESNTSESDTSGHEQSDMDYLLV